MSTRKKDPTPFFVNKAVLCHYSAFFDRFFNGQWKESRNPPQEIKVDLSQKNLRLLHAWLYTGRILAEFDPDSIIALWLYGDYIDSLALRRAALSHLYVMSPGEGLINYESLHRSKIWTEHRGSPLYRWIVTCFAMHWHHSMDKEAEDPHKQYNIPNSFFYDVMKIRSENEHMMDRGEIMGDCPCCNSICRFHEHPNDEEREATCEAGEYEFLATIPHDDEDDIDADSEEAIGEHENQEVDVEVKEGHKEIESDGIKDTEMGTNGKRKAHGDEQEEEVSTKKHKQEEAES